MVEVADKNTTGKSADYAENIMAAFAAGLDDVTDGQDIASAVVQMVDKAPASKLSNVPNAVKAKDLSKANIKNVVLVLKDSSGNIDNTKLKELMAKIAVLENKISQKIAEKNINEIDTNDISQLEFITIEDLNFDKLEREMVLFDAGLETWKDDFNASKYDDLDVDSQDSLADLKSKFDDFNDEDLNKHTKKIKDKIDKIDKIAKEKQDVADKEAQEKGEEKLANLKQKVDPLLTSTKVASVADAKTMFSHIRETANTFIDTNSQDNNTSTILGSQAQMITDNIEPKLEKIANSFSASTTRLDDSIDAFGDDLDINFDVVMTSIEKRLSNLSTAIDNNSNSEDEENNWEVTSGNDTLKYTYLLANNEVTKTLTFNGVTSTMKYPNSNKSDEDEGFDLTSINTTAPIKLTGTGYDLEITTLSFVGAKAALKAKGTITGTNSSSMTLSALDIKFEVNRDEEELKFFKSVEAEFTGEIKVATKSLSGSLKISDTKDEISLTGKYIGASDLSFEGNVVAKFDLDELKQDDRNTDYISHNSLLMAKFTNETQSFITSYSYEYINSNTKKYIFITQNNQNVTCSQESISTNTYYENKFSCENNTTIMNYGFNSSNSIFAIIDGKEKLIQNAHTNSNYTDNLYRYYTIINFDDDYAYVEDNKLLMNGSEIIISDIKVVKNKIIDDVKVSLIANGTLLEDSNKISANISISKEENSNKFMLDASNLEISSSDSFVKITELKLKSRIQIDNYGYASSSSSFKSYKHTYNNNDYKENEYKEEDDYWFSSIEANDISIQIMDKNSKELTFDADIAYKKHSNDDETVVFNGTYSYADTTFVGLVEATNNDMLDTNVFDISGKITPAQGFEPFSIAAAGSSTDKSSSAYALFTRGAGEEYKLGFKFDGNETHTTINLADINGVMSTMIMEDDKNESSEASDNDTTSNEEKESYVFTDNAKKTLATVGEDENGNSWEIKYSDNSSETIF